MTRLVRRRDGNINADTSTSFSDWIQVEDKALAPKTNWVTSSTYLTQIYSETEKAAPDSPAVWSVGELLDFINGATIPSDPELPPGYNPVNQLPPGGGLPLRGGVGAAYFNDKLAPFPGDDDPAGSLAQIGAGWRPYFRLQTCPQTGFSNSWRPDWPADAIGFEVEGVEVEGGLSFVAEPVSARVSLDYEMVLVGGWVGQTLVAFSNQRPPVTVGRSGDFLTYDIDWPSFDYSVTKVQDTTLGHDMKAFGVGEETSGSGVVEITDFSGAPPYSGMFGMSQSAINHEWFSGPDETQMSAGHRVTASVVYTVRPPRIRWIYGDPAPYRRAYPNDAIAEGGRRSFPPSKATQSSRRISGGYL